MPERQLLQLDRPARVPQLAGAEVRLEWSEAGHAGALAHA